jgi:PAS domain S-box-containing protein
MDPDASNGVILDKRSFLKGAIDKLPESFCAIDCEDRLRYVNSAFAEWAGVKRSELLGRSILDFFPSLVTDDSQILENVRSTGQGTTVVIAGPGVDTRVEISIFLVDHTIALLSRDITERVKGERAVSRRLEVLVKSQETGHLGSWSVDFETGLFEASDEDYRIYGLTAGKDVFLERVFSLIHQDDRARYIEYVRSVQEDGLTGALEYRIIWDDGSEHHVVAITDSVVKDQSGKVRMASGITQDITKPKRAEEALRESHERYEELAAENDRLYREQREIAEHLQLALVALPVAVGRVRVGHAYRSATESARVGGDFYDVLRLTDGRLAFMIGDVCGHGIEAARVAVLTRDVIDAFIHETRRPEEALRRANKVLLEKSLPGFVTLFLGVIEPDQASLCYASAGHPSMLVRRAAGEIEALGAGSLPLGVQPGISWKMAETRVQTGDLLLLYTDGVIEARRNGEFFGQEGIEALLSRRQAPVESLARLLIEDVLAFSGGALSDDVAVLALSLA